MKASRKTLMAVKQFLELQEGWDLEELKTEIVAETTILRHEEMGENTLATDECGIAWGDDEICALSDFVDVYTDVFIEKICNILESFVGEDINDYYDED